MLLLSRKHGQSIVIETSDGLIEVMVASVHDHPVQLGITAPKRVEVNRREVYEAIQREGRRNP